MKIYSSALLSIFVAVATVTCGGSSGTNNPAPDSPTVIDPVTGQPVPAVIDPVTGQPVPVVIDPVTGVPVPVVPGQPYPTPYPAPSPTPSPSPAPSPGPTPAPNVGPASVFLGTAGNFAILSKTGVSNVAASAITGKVGTSPITGASLTGLSCIQVPSGFVVVDASSPDATCSTTDPVGLTTNIGDMEIAYADAAGRSNPTTTELGSGDLGGLTIAPGLHKISSNVLITTDVYLSGSANDVWIFQIAGKLEQANGKKVILQGGAQAKNIFWQVAQDVIIGTGAVMNGNILGQTLIALNTGASLNGRALAQTEVTLQSSTVVKP